MPLRGSTTAVFLPQPNNGAVTASQTAPEQRVVWGGTHSQLVASAWLSLAGRLGRGAKLEANRSSTTEAACSESGQHLSLGRRDLCHPGGRALGHDLDGLLRVEAVRTAWLDVGCTRSN